MPDNKPTKTDRSDELENELRLMRFHSAFYLVKAVFVPVIAVAAALCGYLQVAKGIVNTLLFIGGLALGVYSILYVIKCLQRRKELQLDILTMQNKAEKIRKREIRKARKQK